MQSNFQRILTITVAIIALAGCDYVPSWMGGAEKEIERLPGERITALPVKSNINVDAGLANIPVTLPATYANAEWPQSSSMGGAEAGNLSLSSSLGDSESASVGDGEAFEHTLIPRPVVAAGMVFVMDAAGYVSAHDAANVSNRRWQSNGVAEEDDPQLFGGGLAYDQGRLYVSSGRGIVVALDAATGKELWRRATTIPFRSAPRVAEGKLYVVSMDSQLFVLNAATGEILWSHRGINETAGILRAVSPVVANGMVFVPYASGELYALSTNDGRELWNESLSSPARTQATSMFPGIGGDPVVDKEVVFAVSSSGTLSVFNLWNGQRLWDKNISAINTPWLSGDYLFVLTTDNTLAALVKYNGRVRWVMQLPNFEDEEDKKRPITWTGPVMANGRLVLTGSRGQMMLISAADGTVVSQVSIPDDIYTPPVIAGERMYLVSQDAKLYLLK